MRFNSQGIYVYDYGDWVTQRLATNQGLYITEYFDLAFREVADNAERIHYNLEGIRGNPVTFADTQGNQGRFAGTPNWAATELYIIRTEGYCNKTTFWQNGSTSPTPDRTAWQQICS
jgi:hypothetical protein